MGQILSDVKFWLERGVDGFRLDAIKRDLANEIMDEHGEWIRPDIRAIGSTLDNDVGLNQ